MCPQNRSASSLRLFPCRRSLHVCIQVRGEGVSHSSRRPCMFISSAFSSVTCPHFFLSRTRHTHVDFDSSLSPYMHVPALDTCEASTIHSTFVLWCIKSIILVMLLHDPCDAFAMQMVSSSRLGTKSRINDTCDALAGQDSLTGEQIHTSMSIYRRDTSMTVQDSQVCKILILKNSHRCWRTVTDV